MTEVAENSILSDDLTQGSTDLDWSCLPRIIARLSEKESDDTKTKPTLLVVAEKYLKIQAKIIICYTVLSKKTNPSLQYAR